MKSVVYNSYGVWRVYSASGYLKLYSPIVSEEIELMETNFGYSLCCDDKDNIYIICQNNRGDIYFITVNGEKTESRCMLEAKVKEGYEKEFSLTYINGMINALYMLKHEDKYIIIHHIVNSGNQPEIIETLNSSSPLFVCKKEEDIYAIYKKENSLVYRTFQWKEKSWSDAEKICDEEEKILFINAKVYSKVNAVYCSEKRNRFNVVYATDNSKTELIKNSSSTVKPVICDGEKGIHVLFEYGGRILESTGGEEENLISKPRYSYFGTFERSEAVEINTPDSKKLYTYGYETKKGTFKPFVIGEIKVEKISRPAEIEMGEIKEKNVKTENINNPYGEILKLLDKNNEMKILSEMVKRITALENAISKLVNLTEGDRKDGNKNKPE